MKAIFSKLRSKEPYDEKDKGKENNGPNQARKFAQGFSSLSRTTGGKTLQSRQSSGSYAVEKHRNAATLDKPDRPASVTLLSSPYDTPIFNRSSSLYVPADTTRPVTPVGDFVISSLENSYHNTEQGSTLSSRGTYALKPLITERTPVPDESTSTPDTEGTFTASSTTATAGRSFARRWLGKPSQERMTGNDASTRNLSETLQRKDSASSSLSSRFGSRSLSGALSPVSIRSRQSVLPGEDQEYCKSRQSWTGMTEVDLVANLSPQERTRQEVLFEIVSSEER